MSDANRELIRIVEEQGRRPVGIPVLLFTDATLTATGDGGRDDVVDRAAAAAGYDLDQIALFSTEAYLMQAAAGHLTVEG